MREISSTAFEKVMSYFSRNRDFRSASLSECRACSCCSISTRNSSRRRAIASSTSSRIRSSRSSVSWRSRPSSSDWSCSAMSSSKRRLRRSYSALRRASRCFRRVRSCCSRRVLIPRRSCSSRSARRALCPSSNLEISFDSISVKRFSISAWMSASMPRMRCWRC